MLLLCTKCGRHVRGDACPFCGGVAIADDSVKRVARRRMSRGAIVGAAALAVACGTSSPQDDGGVEDSGNDSLQAAYGGPFDASAIDTGTKDATPDSLQGAYGGPPPDAGDGGG